MRLPIIAAVFSFLFAGASLQAQTVKIGYVDLQRAMMEVDEGAEATRKLKADFAKKQQILDRKKPTSKSSKKNSKIRRS